MAAKSKVIDGKLDNFTPEDMAFMYQLYCNEKTIKFTADGLAKFIINKIYIRYFQQLEKQYVK